MRPIMGTESIPDLLAAWRAAERRWERSVTADEVEAAALDVIAAFVAYQDAALPAASNEFMLITDDGQRYVGITRAATTVLGYSADTLLGRTIADIAAPGDREGTPAQWDAFLRDGRQDGTFSLLTSAGEPVALRYVARAHHPIPGYHMSRLWPETPTS
jgi:PAS domain S-box-containing protein